MKASLQEQISPVSQNKSLQINDVENNTSVKEERPDAVDFKSLLLNSNDSVREERAKEKGSDLSSAKNYEEFLTKVNQKTDKERVPKNDLDKNDFLKLFVSQLRHQDPLNPQDGAQMASQLAQFNSLEHMMNINDSLKRMEKSQQNNQAVHNLNYIGKEVLINGGTARLEKGKAPELSFDVTQSTGTLNMVVKNEKGVVVSEKSLGSFLSGTHKVQWDGKNQKDEMQSDGVYSISITGKNEEQKVYEIPTQSRARVLGVSLNEEKPTLNTSSGRIKIEDVKEITERVEKIEKKAIPDVKKAASSDAMVKPEVEVKQASDATVKPEAEVKQADIKKVENDNTGVDLNKIPMTSDLGKVSS